MNNGLNTHNEPDPDNDYYEKAENAEKCFVDLFERAKKVNELHFALALMPEFRGMQEAGLSSSNAYGAR